jgi:hypothetical protein
LVQVESRDNEAIVRISIRDAAIGLQVVMLGFERRQYAAVIDRELNEITQDVERRDTTSVVTQGGRR